MSQTKAVLIDIEGTTTPITFVHDILFPFARRLVSSFLATPSGAPHIALIREQASQDGENSEFGSVAVPEGEVDDAVQAAVRNVEAWMDRDRKVGALKGMQGDIWKGGYASGELKGVVYPDVPVAFQRWTTSNPPLKVYVYSSGSIAAQKLLFGYSDKGDLLPFFSGHFDTTSGLKTESSSYTTIAAAINLEPSKILFLTDNFRESRAARQVGVRTLLLDRPGNAPLSEEERHGETIVQSFGEVDRYL